MSLHVYQNLLSKWQSPKIKKVTVKEHESYNQIKIKLMSKNDKLPNNKKTTVKEHESYYKKNKKVTTK